MKPAGKYYRVYPAVALLLLSLSVAAPVASAQGNPTVKKMADILEAVEDATGGIGWLPVSSGDVRNMDGLFNCLDRAVNSADADREIAVCIDTYESMLGGIYGSIPTWVFDLVELYIAVRADDFWGVVAKLGEAAICAIANIMAMGVDVCALVEALVELGEAVYDTAVAVGEFFVDLGEAVYGAAKDACEFVGICSSDEPPPPPPELVAYEMFFAPRLSDGLNARKSKDPLAFDRLKQEIIAKASEGVRTSEGVSHFPPYALRTAADIYTNAVDKIWTGDMIDKVLPARRAKRLPYDDPSNVRNMATFALAEFEQGAYPDPTTNQPSTAGYVLSVCDTTFRDSYGFAHVDRWIASHPQDAAGVQAETNRDWCRVGFFLKNRKLFAERFRDAVQRHICNGDYNGGSILCQSEESYQRCLGIMGGLTGHGDECVIDTRAMGREAAERIVEELRRRGSNQSLHACSIEDPAQPTGHVDLDCPRPTQGYYCMEIYQQLYGGTDVRAPLMDCTVTRTSAYRQLEAAAASAAASVENTHGDVLEVGIDRDPLVVQVRDVGSLAKIRPDVEALGYKATLALDRKIDGESAPVFHAEPPTVGKPELASLRGAELVIEEKIPVSPEWSERIGVEQIVTSPTISFSKLKATPDTGFKRIQATPKAGFESAQIPTEGVTPPAELPVETEMKPMMGGAPPGSEVPTAMAPKSKTTTQIQPLTKKTLGATLPHEKGKEKSAEVKAAPEKTPKGASPLEKMPRGDLSVPATRKPASTTPGRPPALASVKGSKALPDLTAADKVDVGSKGEKWGSSIFLDAKSASSFRNGLCVYPVRITVTNGGSAAVGSFKSKLGSSAATGTWEKTWSGLEPGKSSSENGNVSLKPGKNTITLTLDQDRSVDESNEKNNEFGLTVIVNGQCGLVLRPVKPVLPTGKTPSAPKATK